MVSFASVVFKNRQRKDGTFAVFVRVTYRRKSCYMSTPLSATRQELSRDYEIRSSHLLLACAGYIERMKKRLESFSYEATFMTVKEICSRLGESENRIDFLKLIEDRAAELRRNGSDRSAANYGSLLNRLREFSGASLDINEVTSSWLKELEVHLRGRMKSRGVELYMGIIRAVYNEAYKRYNEMCPGAVRTSPFTFYSIPASEQAAKRNISASKVLEISQLRGLSGRAALAREVFMLSFCLCGMNSIDIYNLNPLTDDGRICHRRSKTKHRKDGAYFELEFPDILRKLLLRRADDKGERLFSYYREYSNEQNFNRSVNLGLKRVGELVGLPNLQLYSARHTWATVAANDCGVAKDVVAQALVHSSSTVTDIYINRSFRAVDEANAKVILHTLKNVLLEF